MAQTIAVSTNTLTEILKTLKAVRQELAVVREKLEEAPPYGSDEWWQWSIKKSEEDFKKGDYFELRSAEELDDFFNNIKKDGSNEKYHHRVLEKSRKTTT